MPEDCPEKFDWEFTKWVWNFAKRPKPKIEKLLKKYENEKIIFRLTSKREIENLLQGI